MSAPHHDSEEHESGIKTPKQLIAVIVASFVVPVVVIIMLTQLVGLQTKKAPGTDALTPEAVAKRIHPIGAVVVKDASSPAALQTGEQVYAGRCSGCHAAGALGAPKFGDAAAWGPRLAQGYEKLLASALNGKNAMPPQKGGDYSDYEIARAVVYMANKGGANFAEPKAPAAAASAPADAASK